MSSSEGKTEKSSARFTYMLVRRMITAPTRLSVIRRSMSWVGQGYDEHHHDEHDSRRHAHQGHSVGTQIGTPRPFL